MKSCVSQPRSASPGLRLDQALVSRGLCESREQAKRAVLAGRVRLNHQRARKASETVRARDELVLDQGELYVSRGGYKLERALQVFGISVLGKTAIDVGSSTGGFTDCLLQRGAARVYAVDVGRGQLAWKLRQHPRVIVMEGTNARYLIPERFPKPFASADLVVADCSFISILKLLVPIAGWVKPDGCIVALIKPQFEVGKREAARGKGVITDPQVQERVVQEIRSFVAAEPLLQWCDCIESPLRGPAGNKEFLAFIERIY